MSFLSEENAPTVISSILEIGPVSDCRNVNFVILGIDQPTHLQSNPSQTGSFTTSPKKESVTFERTNHLR